MRNNRYYVPISAGQQFRRGGFILLLCVPGTIFIDQTAHFFHHDLTGWRHYLPFLIFIPAAWLAWRSFKNGWRVWCAQWRARFGR